MQLTATNLAPTMKGFAAGITEERLDEFRLRLESRRTGFSLEAPFYTDPHLFNLDMQAIFGQHWVFACSVAEIPEPGDYVTLDYGPYSIIVLRTDDGGVNIIHNVCRHRGARVLTELKGTTGNLVCGYHSWTYSPEGELIHASAPGEMSFDKSCYSLKRGHGTIISGLVFLCLSEEPPTDFLETGKIFAPYVGPHELEKTKVAYQQNIIEEANWKLVMENNRECYHCDGHPELACSLFPTWGADRRDDPTAPRRRLGPQPAGPGGTGIPLSPLRAALRSRRRARHSHRGHPHLPRITRRSRRIVLSRRTSTLEEAARRSA